MDTSLIKILLSDSDMLIPIFFSKRQEYTEEPLSLEEIKDKFEQFQLISSFDSIFNLFEMCVNLPSQEEEFTQIEPKTFFNVKNIETCISADIFPYLTKNLATLINILLETPSDSLNEFLLEIFFVSQLNLILQFGFLQGGRDNSCFVDFLKECSDCLEETALKVMKHSHSVRMLPVKNSLVVYLTYLEILFSKSSEATTRQKSKQNCVTRENYEQLIKQDPPKYLLDYKKEDLFIERFFRNNIIKTNANDADREVIVNILKLLLASCKFDMNDGSQSEESTQFKEQPYLYILTRLCSEDEKVLYKAKKECLSKHILKFKVKPVKLIEIQNDYFERTYEEMEVEEADFFFLSDVITKFLTCTVIIRFYRFIIKELKAYDTIQFTYLAFHLTDTNGLLVLLRFLNQDLLRVKSLCKEIYDSKNILFDYSPLVDETLIDNLSLIFHICNKNEEYVHKYLFGLDVYKMLKKNINQFNENEKIKKKCLKLLKIQVKYYDNAWRKENNGVISLIYLYLKNDNEKQIDNWLRFEKKRESRDELTLEELKKIHHDYNYFNYYRFHSNPELVTQYKQKKENSLYVRLMRFIESKAVLTEEMKKDWKKLI